MTLGLPAPQPGPPPRIATQDRHPVPCHHDTCRLTRLAWRGRHGPIATRRSGMRGVCAGPRARARRAAGGVWVTVSIRKISLGAGYRYLMASVARGDGAEPASSPLTRYYVESGTPPGRFLGAGLAGLAGGQGVRAGSTVTEEHLFRMLGMLQDPISGEQLDRPPRVTGRPTSTASVGRGSRRVQWPGST